MPVKSKKQQKRKENKNGNIINNKQLPHLIHHSVTPCDGFVALKELTECPYQELHTTLLLLLPLVPALPLTLCSLPAGVARTEDVPGCTSTGMK